VQIDVTTADGRLDCYVFTPPGEGRWPAVILYMDAFGIRPRLGEMAQRLASNGYFVVVPNLYYRSGEFEPFDPALVFSEGPERDRFKGMIQSIDATMVMRDTAAVIDMLDTQPSAQTDRIGVVGYCMGGGFALSAAGTFPDRVAAAASFHGGSLATDKPDSAHLLAPRMRGRVYVGVAETDPGFSREQQNRLEEALSAGGVDYAIETYQGTKHGFAVTGHPVYDRTASERHWRRLLDLLKATLDSQGTPSRVPPEGGSMKRAASGFLIAMCVAATALAQAPQAPAGQGQARQGGGRGPAAPACSTLQCDMLADWTRTRDALIGVANAMPDDKYSFKPTPAQESFAQRLMHVAQIDVKLLSGLGGKTAAPALNASAATKADVVAALTQSFAYGEAVIKEFNDQQLLERVTPMPFLGPSASRVRILSYDLQHTQDIYGQLVVYLRLNGVTPPLSNRGGV
jgi:carboxymethylenebutenolidase